MVGVLFLLGGIWDLLSVHVSLTPIVCIVERAMVLCSASAKSVSSAVTSVASRLKPARSERWMWVFLFMAAPGGGARSSGFMHSNNAQNRHIRCGGIRTAASSGMGTEP